jgi:hypothetical protein
MGNHNVGDLVASVGDLVGGLVGDLVGDLVGYFVGGLGVKLLTDVGT